MPEFELVCNEKGTRAKITSRGEVVVAPVAYSVPYFTLVTNNTDSFEVLRGIGRKWFVITALLITSSKSFGSATNAETITIYEANPADLSINLNTITQIDMTNNQRMPVTGLNLITGESTSLVAVATDNDVSVTVAGYYVDAL